MMNGVDVDMGVVIPVIEVIGGVICGMIVY